MKIEKSTESAVIEAFTAAPIFTVTNTTHVRLRITACPASMLANRRIISANGFVKIPTSSIAGIIGTGHLSHTGTSGQKISFQYSRVPNRFTATNVHNANTIVIAILPVTLAPPGKIGISPMMLLMKMKKKTVSRYGANRQYPNP